MSLFNNKYNYPTLNRVEVNGRRLYDTGVAKVPSVTTIISYMKDMTGINKWRDRIGHAEAQRILTESANLGTATHKHLEQHIFGEERKAGGNLIHQIATKLADIIIDEGLSNINEIWGSEVSLYSPELYAGTTDCVGIWKDKPAIIDFKTSRSVKKREWIDDYFLQGVAYAMAHNELFDSNIQTVVIMMVTHDGQYLEFTISDEDFVEYTDKWLDKLKDYYQVNDKY
jgi:genome maintenance exonuclease 1|tara:strand:- start:102 stop:782 length:681 start_codon:yes stop_codon:yes gene_type:complete